MKQAFIKYECFCNFGLPVVPCITRLRYDTVHMFNNALKLVHVLRVFILDSMCSFHATKQIYFVF